MSKIKSKIRAGYELWAVYAILLGVCIYLAVTSQNRDAASITINFAMFLIIGLAFLFAVNKLSILEDISDELVLAATQIREDAAGRGTGELLWPVYRQKPGHGLFSVGRLSEPYRQFCEEMERYDTTTGGLLKCDIEDYINYDYFDGIAAKSILNTFPGLMTGLGILGTFLGLSIGLNQFNVGSATEITNSIAPLMDGIKVAFHTSVYGMIFSLFFNWLYKKAFENAYSSLDDFYAEFDKHVIGDPQRYNANATQLMIESLPGKIDDALSPHFQSLEETLSKFVVKIADSQIESLSAVTDAYIEKLNSSTGSIFRNLENTLEETCRLQEKSSRQLEAALERIENMTGSTQQINRMSQEIIRDLSGYIANVQMLQKEVNENYLKLSEQINRYSETEERQLALIENSAAYEKAISESTAGLKASVEQVLRESVRISGKLDQSALRINRAADNLNGQLEKSLGTIYQSYDRSLTDITRQLNGTIQQMSEMTGKMPRLFSSVRRKRKKKEK